MSEEGLTATKHEKIFVTEPMHLKMEELQEKLDKLETLEYDENYSREHVKETLKSVVPTFKDPEEVNNIKKND